MPAGSTVTTGTTATAAQHNTPLQDLETDANAARPIIAGGTGATSVSGARGKLAFYDDVAALQASTEASRGAGAIWEAGGFRYEEVTTGADVTTAGGVKLSLISVSIPKADVAAVLADAATWYPVGAIIRTAEEGFAYEVVTTGADITTAGGVGLKVLKFPAPYVVLKQNADATGTSNSHAAIQRQIDNDGICYVPKGTFRLDSPLVLNTDVTRSAGLIFKGAGNQRTFLDYRGSSGHAIQLEQGSANQFGLMHRLEDFAIIGDNATSTASGLLLEAAQQFLVDAVWVNNMPGEGITIRNQTVGDAQQSVGWEILRSVMRNNGGKGLLMDYANSAAQGYRIGHCRFDNNTGGGAQVVSYGGLIDQNGFVTNSTQAQLLVKHISGTTNRTLDIMRNFFEKGRAGELEIESLIGGEISRNTFSSNDSSSGPFAVKIGSVASTRNLNIHANLHIVNSTIAGTYNCYDFRGFATVNVVRDIEFNDISTATKYAFTANAAMGGNEVINTVDDQRKTLGGGATLTPDLTEGTFIHVVCVGSTAIIANPVNHKHAGARLSLGINNSSGGTLSVSFGSAFQTQGYTDPASGAWTIAEFRYDDTSDVWRQMGAWT